VVVLTVAVSVTFPPDAILVTELVKFVVVTAGVMLNVSAAELLALKLGSPLYFAMIEFAPPFKTMGPVKAALSVLIPTLLASVVVVRSTKSTVPLATKFPVIVGLSPTSARKNAVCGYVPGTKAVPLLSAKMLAMVKLGCGPTVTEIGAESLGPTTPSPG